MKQRIVLLLALVLSTMLVSACSNSSAATQKITPQDYVSQYAQSTTNHILVDVRTPEEYAGGHIAGAVNIPLQDISSRMSEIAKDIPAIIYCRSGNRSAQAMAILADAGYTKIYDLGGVIQWTEAGYSLEQ